RRRRHLQVRRQALLLNLVLPRNQLPLSSRSLRSHLSYANLLYHPKQRRHSAIGWARADPALRRATRLPTVSALIHLFIWFCVALQYRRCFGSIWVSFHFLFYNVVFFVNIIF